MLSNSKNDFNEKTTHILIIQTAFIGDVFLMIPLLRAIKNHFQNQINLTVVLREGLGDFLKKLNLVDHYIEIKKSNKDSYKEAISKAHIICPNYDYLFCPHESFRSAVLSKKINSKLKIGFYKWWNFIFFQKRIVKNYSLSEPLRQLQLIEVLTSDYNQYFKINHSQEMNFKINEKLSMSGFENQIIGSKATRARLKEQLGLSGDQKYIALFPGSVWPTKQWTLNGFTEITKKFISSNYKVILMGSKQEFELCQSLASAITKISNSSFEVINTAGKYSLWDSFLILSDAKLAITNDSGSMHMAAIADVPTVAIFGPTTLELGFRPWQNRAIVVEDKTLNCRPCGKHGHKSCPLKHHKCMTQVSNEQVWSACQNLLSY